MIANGAGHSIRSTQQPENSENRPDPAISPPDSERGRPTKLGHPKLQEVEVLIACNILNGMATLGRPASCAIGA
jgi:hypothetical protein